MVEAFLVSVIANNMIVDFADKLVNTTKIIVKYQVNSITNALDSAADKLSDIFNLDKVNTYEPVTPPSGIESQIQSRMEQMPIVSRGTRNDRPNNSTPIVKPKIDKNLKDESLDALLDDIQVNTSIIPKGVKEVTPKSSDTRQTESRRQPSRNSDQDEAYGSLPGFN
jgi:hypothetical protein